MAVIFFSSFAVAFSGAMMPGPLFSLTVSESARKGFTVGPLLILGHAILEIVLLIALLFGLAPLFNNPVFFILVSIAGGIILFWMGFSMLRALPSARLSQEKEKKEEKRLVLKGILMSLANPYWIIWWATIGIGYILHSKEFGPWGIILFFIGHILADLVWYSLISGAVSKGKNLFTDTIYKWLMGVCASLMIGFSVYFLYSGFSRI